MDINGFGYSLDLNKISEFIFESKDGCNTEITENYEPSDFNDEKMILANRIIRETKGNEDADVNIRYDLIKLLLIQIFNMANEPTLSFGDMIVMKTLLEHNLIKKTN